MDNLDKQFRVSSPKPREPKQDDDFNDFQYWHEPVLEVEELKRLDTLYRLAKRETRDIDDPLVGVNGTIRRSGKSMDHSVAGIQPNRTTVQPTNIDAMVVNRQFVTIQSSSESRVSDRVAPKPPLPQPLPNPAPASTTPANQKCIPSPPTSQNVIVFDGRTVDDGNFIQGQKYHYIVDGKKADDSNFIKEEKYLVLPNGQRVPKAKLQVSSNLVTTHSESIAAGTAPHNIFIFKGDKTDTNTTGQSTAMPLDSKGSHPSLHTETLENLFVLKTQVPPTIVPPSAPVPLPKNETPFVVQSSGLPKRIETGISRNPSSRMSVVTPVSTFSPLNRPPNHYPIPPLPNIPIVNATCVPIIPIPVQPIIPTSSNNSTDGSHTTLTVEPVSSSPPKSKSNPYWWQKIQMVRAISFGIYTYLTTFDGLNDPRVAKLGGRPVLYAILVFSALDMLFSIIKAWPRQLWLFWKVQNWDAIRSISSVWAIIADHELLMDIVPLIGNFSLRIYSYRMTELIENPATDFTLDKWNNPKYTNFVLLMLWAFSIGISILFHTIGRLRYLGVRHESLLLAFLFLIKACLFTFDIAASCIFLYVFLVPLGTNIFGSSPDIVLFLTVIISSPVVTTICNAFINLPLVYQHCRIESGSSPKEALKESIKKLYTPHVSFFTLFAIYNTTVTLYMLSKLQMISLQPTVEVLVDLVQFNPQNVAIWLIGVNVVINYMIGIASTLLYWLLTLLPFTIY